MSIFIDDELCTGCGNCVENCVFSGVEIIDNKAIIIQSRKPSTKKYFGKIHNTVDARNLSCPKPVMMSKKALEKLEIGQVLEVLATDPGSKRDIPAWAQVTGQELITVEDRNPEEFRFLVKKLK